MEETTKKVLLIEDNPADIRFIQEILKETKTKELELICVKSLDEAVKSFSKFLYKAILLDLGLPDSQGLKTLIKIQEVKPELPIVVMTGLDDENVGLQAVKEGAQDYLIKDNVNGYLLTRALNYAVERKKTEEEIKKSREQLRNLSQHIEDVREEERVKLTTGLHEDLSQIFAAVKMDLSWLEKRLLKQQGTEVQKIKSLRELIDKTQDNLLNTSHQIRPSHLDYLGLLPAIEWYAEEFYKRTGIECSTIFETKDINIDEDLSVNLFRVLQEVLDNVEKHSKANKVMITTAVEEDVFKMGIRDDGIGISEEKIHDTKSLGLLSIKERVLQYNGKTDISGKTGDGTVVEVKIPKDNFKL